MRTAVYPGSFDPVTNGHISLIRRGLDIFDHIIVGVAEQTPHPPMFPLETRLAMLRDTLAGSPNVEVVPISGLTVNCTAEFGACAMLRGMRALYDFESEFQMALMNRRIRRDIETVFLMTDYQWLYTSSSIVKSAAKYGGDISGLVPEHVRHRISSPDDSYTPVPTAPLRPESGKNILTAEERKIRSTAVYPGTFDPVTSGHLSIIRRALNIFDTVVVAVAENAGKGPLFSLEERTEFIREALKEYGDRVSVAPYSGLTVDFANEIGAGSMVRGLRATGDFEYEFQLALMNRKLSRHIQTVFLMTDYQWLFVSSSMVKAAASHGADIDGLVPPNVKNRLSELYSQGRINQSTPCFAAPVSGYGAAK